MRGTPAARRTSARGSGDWWNEVEISASSGASARTRSVSAATSAGSTGGGSPRIHGQDQVQTSSTPGSRAAASAPAGPARARLVEGQPTPTLQVDDTFDRAWRRVGIALDRSGFTVEDRDRAQGLYFVRYVDPSTAGREEPSFFSKIFSRKKTDSGLAKYRVKVNTEGTTTTVAVLDSQGKAETGDAGKRIVNLLLEDLR